jgi:hypothetical protein
MDFIPGKDLIDCFDEFSPEQATRTATDLADIVSQLFSITSNYCGSLLRDYSLTEDQYPPRYKTQNNNPGSMAPHSEFVDCKLRIGPLNDIHFLDFNYKVPAASCGPFISERQFLEAFAGRGIPPTRVSTRTSPWAFNKILEVYDAVRPLYHTPSENPTFHFAHGDLSQANIHLDPDTGAVTGILDWEMSGFRPAWLSAAAPAWFDDDSRRFVADDDQQDGPYGYEDETEDKAKLREHFRSELAARNPDLFKHFLGGVELRAMFYNLCHELHMNAQGWLLIYEKYEWDVAIRGPFPFDIMGWLNAQSIESKK